MSISEIDVQISYTKVKRQELYITSLKKHHSKLLDELKKEKINLIKLNKASFEEAKKNEDFVPIDCRWGEKCTNSKCGYAHPNGRTFVPKTLCWNGDKCTRKNCSFKH
jgi:hypothetical protein